MKIRNILIPFGEKEQRYRSCLFLSVERNQDPPHLDSFWRKETKTRPILASFLPKGLKMRVIFAFWAGFKAAISGGLSGWCSLELEAELGLHRPGVVSVLRNNLPEW